MPDAVISCPKCTADLDKAIVYDVEVDACPRCGGLWLDAGEIQRLARLPDRELADLKVMLAQASEVTHLPGRKGLNCPACPGSLEERAMGPVQVDWCKRCRGFYLDRGELMQSVKTTRAGSAGEVLVAAARAWR